MGIDKLYSQTFGWCNTLRIYRPVNSTQTTNIRKNTKYFSLEHFILFQKTREVSNATISK